MAFDDEAVAQAKDIVRGILKKFPEAKPELRAMITNIDKGESVVLTGVQDLGSKLSLMKLFAVLRLRAVERGPGLDKKFERQPKSVQLLRRRFKDMLSIPPSDLESDSSSSESSGSDDSSSESSGHRRKKKKKDKKRRKEKKKSKKKKDKKSKKEKKEKKRRERVYSDDEGDETTTTTKAAPTEECVLPGPLPAPTAAPPPPLSAADGDAVAASAPLPLASASASASAGGGGGGGDSDSDDGFGPSVSYRDAVGEDTYLADRGENLVVAPRTAADREAERAEGAPRTKGREEWMTTLPEGGFGELLRGVDYRRGGGSGGGRAAPDSAKAARARNDWTMTPEERRSGTKRPASAVDDAEVAEKARMEEMRRRQDAEANARARRLHDEANEGRKGKSLTDIHKEMLAKKEAEAGGEGQGAGGRAWNLETELREAGRVDTARLNSVVQNAGTDLRNKFGHGSRHYL